MRWWKKKMSGTGRKDRERIGKKRRRREREKREEKKPNSFNNL